MYLGIYEGASKCYQDVAPWDLFSFLTFYTTFSTALNQLHKNLKLPIGCWLSSSFSSVILLHIIFCTTTDVYATRIPIIIHSSFQSGAGLAGVENVYNNIISCLLVQFRRTEKIITTITIIIIITSYTVVVITVCSEQSDAAAATRVRSPA